MVVFINLSIKMYKFHNYFCIVSYEASVSPSISPYCHGSFSFCCIFYNHFRRCAGHVKVCSNMTMSHIFQRHCNSELAEFFDEITHYLAVWYSLTKLNVQPMLKQGSAEELFTKGLG